jgi:hydroxymethylbilane synthase
VSATVRVGTRGSALARAQAALVVDALAAIGLRARIVVIPTAGDLRPPDTVWGEGAFVRAIERALVSDDIDIAVHSAKDLPTEEDPRLWTCAFLRREDARDALVVPVTGAEGSMAGLRPGARLGTDSPRRAAFALAARPDVVIRPLHGNVDTRLDRLDAGEVDALVLAVAGLVRLGRADRIAERLPVSLFPPAPGQGAIAIQIRTDAADLAATLARLAHHDTAVAVEAERAYLRACGGGCRAPVGAYAHVEGPVVRISGGRAREDGCGVVFGRIEAPIRDATLAAAELAMQLGARVQRTTSRPAPRRGRRSGGSAGSGTGPARVADRARPARSVLVTRPEGADGELGARLRDLGIEPVAVPAIAIERVQGGRLHRGASRMPAVDRVVVTSANGARAALAAAQGSGVDPATVAWAAVGETTVRVLEDAGARDVWRPRSPSGRHLADELPVRVGSRVVLFRGSLADPAVARRLRERGCRVTDVTAYRTTEAPPSSRPLLERALAGYPPDAVIFASGSAVRGLLALAGDAHGQAVRSLPAICIGPETAAEARRLGFRVLAVALRPAPESLAQLASRLLADVGHEAPA